VRDAGPSNQIARAPVLRDPPPVSLAVAVSGPWSVVCGADLMEWPNNVAATLAEEQLFVLRRTNVSRFVTGL